MINLLIIVTCTTGLAFGYFFLKATDIDPRSIQTADQQVAASLEMIKAGLAWLAFCVGFTGLAIIDYLKEHFPPVRTAQQNQQWKTCNHCGTTSTAEARICHSCRKPFTPIQGTPIAQPEPPAGAGQGQQPRPEPQVQGKPPRQFRLNRSRRERVILVLIGILMAGCATFLGAYLFANHQNSTAKVTPENETSHADPPEGGSGHFGIPRLGEIVREADKREITGWKVLPEYCRDARQRMDSAHDREIENVRSFAHRDSRSYEEYESRGIGILDRQDWEIVQLQAECDLRTQELKGAGARGSP